MTKKSNLQAVKKNNKNLILKLIFEHESISRAELKRMTGLAPTTVSTLVEELIEKGLVKETGIFETGSIGRKAVSIEINPEGRYFAGVEIDDGKAAIGIYDLRFNEVLYYEAALRSYDEIIRFIIESLKDANNKLNATVYSTAIGISGVVDMKNNRVLLSTVVDVVGENFAADIRAEFEKMDVFLVNSSGLIAYAEMEKRGIKDLVTVDIGKGVGAGIIIDGNIYTGAGGTAGEFGHISVDMNGEKCKCGNRGCTELYTNTDAIRKKAEKILGEDNVTLARIRKEAESGNKDIIAMIDHTAEILSYALVGLVNMMAPESVVINGRIKELGNVFLRPLKDAVGEKCSLRQTQIEYSSVEGNAVTLGGAQYTFENMINRI